MTDEAMKAYNEALSFTSKEFATLKDMMHLVQEVNYHNGWFDNDRTFGDDIALLHSEVSEAFEAYRDHGTLDATEPAHSEAPPKPEGIGSELADVLVRLLDTCYRYDIDLSFEFWRKMKYNATRPHRHGGKNV